ncbi:MAG: hypothetical protein J0H88_24490 [Sphingomonadales bacterium]|nr:hypothetical protein [Sphingomonadales bacterium]
MGYDLLVTSALALVSGAMGAVVDNDASAFQAFGDAPIWTVVVDAGGMSVAIEENGEPVFRYLPAPVVSQMDKDRIFTTRTANGTFVELRVAEAPCAGAGEQLAMRATLLVGPTRREGCARTLSDAESTSSRPLLGDLAMDGRIVSKGGPPGFELDLQNGGTTLMIDGRVLSLGKPIAVQLENAPWPTIAGNAATYALASDDEAVTASATVEAASCEANDRTYPLTLKLVVEGKVYRSCASQAYQDLPLLAPSTVAPLG